MSHPYSITQQSRCILAALLRLYSGCGIVDILMMVMATTRDKMLDDIGKMRQ